MTAATWPLWLLAGFCWAWAVLASASRRAWRAEAECLARRLEDERRLSSSWADALGRRCREAELAHRDATFYRREAERYCAAYRCARDVTRKLVIPRSN